jgi:hypothetical protein
LGLVINPRGTSGAGKTWLVREVMAAYRRGGSEPSAIMRQGRSRPIGWRLSHPTGGRTLCVVGDYQGARGGTDTIPLTDGGLDEAFRIAASEARAGHHVLLEGYQLSGEHDRTVELAHMQRSRGQALHVLCLDVPLSRCVENLVRRRRAGHAARPAIERTAQAGQDALAHACFLLSQARVRAEWLDPAAALRRTLALLGLTQAIAKTPTPPWSVEGRSAERLRLASR